MDPRGSVNDSKATDNGLQQPMPIPTFAHIRDGQSRYGSRSGQYDVINRQQYEANIDCRFRGRFRPFQRNGVDSIWETSLI